MSSGSASANRFLHVGGQAPKAYQKERIPGQVSDWFPAASGQYLRPDPSSGQWSRVRVDAPVMRQAQFQALQCRWAKALDASISRQHRQPLHCRLPVKRIRHYAPRQGTTSPQRRSQSAIPATWARRQGWHHEKGSLHSHQPPVARGFKILRWARREDKVNLGRRRDQYRWLQACSAASGPQRRSPSFARFSMASFDGIRRSARKTLYRAGSGVFGRLKYRTALGARRSQARNMDGGSGRCQD